MRQHKMTNHKAEMAIVNGGPPPAQVSPSPSLKELPGPSGIPAPVLSSSQPMSVRTTSSQTVQVAKDNNNSAVDSVPSSPLQFNSPQTPQQSRSTTTTTLPLSQPVVPTTGTLVNVTTSSVQGKEGLNSVLANYVKTKALKTNHNQSPSSQQSQSESTMTTQILLPFTIPAAAPTQVTLSAPMSAPAKLIKAPMLQRQLMSPLKPLPNVLIKDAVATGLINGTSAIAK